MSIPSHDDPTPAAVLAVLSDSVRARRMPLSEALSRAFLCGMNAALHAQQDREAAESGAYLAVLASTRRAG